MGNLKNSFSEGILEIYIIFVLSGFMKNISLEVSFELLLFGSSFLSWLLGRLLSGGLLGSLLSGLLGLLSLGFLSLLNLLGLLSFLSLGLLCLLDLLSLDGDKLEFSSSLSRSSGLRQSSLGKSTLEGETDLDGGLGSVHLVVGHDVLEDGLAGGASPLLQSLQGGGDHCLVRRVSGLLGRGLLLGGLSGVSHCVVGVESGGVEIQNFR